jgi:(p)ppGpp synthase/HD superfamily hydrolase
MPEPPAFIADSDLLSSAYRLARSAHHGPAREGETDIDHPLAVAEVLQANGFEESIVAAGLLHDVVEDTSIDVEAIEKSFGSEVGRLVAEMTENSRIETYEERKAEHRARVARDPPAAAIYAADKLASTRELAEGGGGVSEEKLDHYLETLRMLCRRYPELPFLPQLREELESLAAPRRPD